MIKQATVNWWRSVPLEVKVGFLKYASDSSNDTTPPLVPKYPDAPGVGESIFGGLSNFVTGAKDHAKAWWSGLDPETREKLVRGGVGSLLGLPVFAGYKALGGEGNFAPLLTSMGLAGGISAFAPHTYDYFKGLRAKALIDRDTKLESSTTPS